MGSVVKINRKSWGQRAESFPALYAHFSCLLFNKSWVQAAAATLKLCTPRCDFLLPVKKKVLFLLVKPALFFGLDEGKKNAHSRANLKPIFK